MDASNRERRSDAFVPQRGGTFKMKVPTPVGDAEIFARITDPAQLLQRLDREIRSRSSSRRVDALAARGLQMQPEHA